MLKALLRTVGQGLCLSLPLAAGAQAASVVFLNPGHSNENFWVSYSRFMQAAAQDLGMELRVQYSERRADLALSQARAILKGRSGPITWCWSTSNTWRRRSSACHVAAGSSCFWSTTA